MDLAIIIGIIIGLACLLAVVFAAFLVVTLFEAAWTNQNSVEYYDDMDDLFDEEHHVRPLLGVVHPKEKK